MRELIARLEQAVEGSRELDREIAEEALGQVTEWLAPVNSPVMVLSVIHLPREGQRVAGGSLRLLLAPPQAGRKGRMTDRRPSALPFGTMPRLLSLDQAAEYCGLGVTSFLNEVAAGTYPGPVELTKTRRKVWDVRALDAAIDRATGNQAGSNDREARKRAWQDRRARRAQEAG